MRHRIAQDREDPRASARSLTVRSRSRRCDHGAEQAASAARRSRDSRSRSPPNGSCTSRRGTGASGVLAQQVGYRRQPRSLTRCRCDRDIVRIRSAVAGKVAGERPRPMRREVEAVLQRHEVAALRRRRARPRRRCPADATVIAVDPPLRQRGGAAAPPPAGCGRCCRCRRTGHSRRAASPAHARAARRAEWRRHGSSAAPAPCSPPGSTAARCRGRRRRAPAARPRSSASRERSRRCHRRPGAGRWPGRLAEVDVSGVTHQADDRAPPPGATCGAPRCRPRRRAAPAAAGPRRRAARASAGRARSASAMARAAALNVSPYSSAMRAARRRAAGTACRGGRPLSRARLASASLFGRRAEAVHRLGRIGEQPPRREMRRAPAPRRLARPASVRNGSIMRRAAASTPPARGRLPS